MDASTLTETLRRPRLLIKAALLGLRDYNRNRVLKRLISAPAAPRPGAAVTTLVCVEERLEAARRSGDASYTPSRHVEVLIALLAELRLQARLGNGA